MCPDREILSLYYDRELPSPWKEKLELHLESCSSCCEILHGYEKLSLVMQEEFVEEQAESRIASAMERVYSKLPNSLSEGKASDVSEVSYAEIHGRRNRKSARKSFPLSLLWNRSVSLPMPIAAGALVIFLMTFIFGFYNSRTANNEAINRAEATGIMDVQPINPNLSVDSTALISDYLLDEGLFQDMNSIIQYFSAQDGSDIVIISLPENRRFYHAGEPELINASDFSRRSGPR